MGVSSGTEEVFAGALERRASLNNLAEASLRKKKVIGLQHHISLQQCS